MVHAPATPSAPAARPRRWLWRRWVTVTTAGELAGFGVPAVTAAAAVSAELADPVLLALVVAAGAAEGASLSLGAGNHPARGHSRGAVGLVGVGGTVAAVAGRGVLRLAATGG